MGCDVCAFSLLPLFRPDLSARYDQWRSQRELKPGFGRNVQFFSLGQDLHGGCAPGAYSRADGSTLTTACNRADNGANTGAESGPSGGLAATVLAYFVVLGRRKVVGNAIDDKLREF